MASAMLESNAPGEGVYEKQMSQDKKRVVCPAIPSAVIFELIRSF